MAKKEEIDIEEEVQKVLTEDYLLTEYSHDTVDRYREKLKKL